MSQFILDKGSPKAAKSFDNLDSFTQGYITCAFWLLDEELSERTLADLAGVSWLGAIDICSEFQAKAAHELAEAYATGRYNAGKAGHDFFLTRNHHGAGFWDRGLGKVGDRLTEMAHAYGEANLYLGDDDKLYF